VTLLVDCAACQHGDHEGHVAGHNAVAGRLGGWQCPCPGDCDDRYRDQAHALADLVPAPTDGRSA
jgi:hypothetical protein